MKRTVILLAILVSIALTMSAQIDGKGRTVALWGHVKDSFTKSGIPETRVTLMTSDSIVVDTMCVFNMGKFNATKIDVGYRFHVPARPARYIIKAEHPDYEICYINYEIKHVARNTYFDAPWHLMKRKTSVQTSREGGELGTVVVKATRVKMIYKGDTIVFNADAFNLPEGSMLDALVRQMDGVELKDDGRILVNGQQIDELTLNGKDFFRGHNKIMLENLPHYVVSNIQVYHKQTELSSYLGRDVEKRKYVMDVVLKREYAQGFLGNIEVARGTSGRQLGRLFGMRYTDHSRLSLYGNANNVNENRRPGINGEWTPANAPQGLRTTGQAGMDLLIDQADKRWKENVWAQMEWSKVDDRTTTLAERFLSNAPSTYSLERSSSLGRYLELHVANRFELMNPLHLMSFTEIRYNRSDPHSASDDWHTSAPLRFDTLVGMLSPQTAQSAVFINYSHVRFRQQRNRLYGGSFAELTKKLPTGDEVGVTINANFHDQHQKGLSQQHVTYFQVAGQNMVQNRYSHQPDKEYSWYVKPNYTITWLNGLSLRSELSYSQQYNSETNNTFLADTSGVVSYNTGMVTVLDAANSFERMKLNRRYEVLLMPQYHYEKKDKYVHVMLRLPINHLRERMNYHGLATDTVLSQRAWTFVPQLNMRVATHGWTRQYNLDYSVEVNLPSLYNKVNACNSENPLFIHLGNPGLKRSIVHRMQSYFSRTWRELQQSLVFGYGLRFFPNAVSQGYSYNPVTGVYTYRPQNVKGNWQTYYWSSFVRPIDKKRRLTFSNYSHGDYSRNVDVVSSQTSLDAQAFLSHVDNYYMEDRLGLNYRVNELSLGAQGYVEYRYASNKEGTVNNIHALNFSYGITCNYNFKEESWNQILKGISLATDLKMFSRRGYGDASLNSNDLVWNASVSRTFSLPLAKKSGGGLTARLEAFDILHKLSNTQIAINGQGRTEKLRNTLPRYLMLHLTCHFNKIPKNKR